MRFYWLGALIGSSLFSRTPPLVRLLGAVAGFFVERWIRQNAEGEAARRQAANELVVLRAISAMLAKIAKADGRISADEVRYCERLFDSLRLRGERRAFCIRVFQGAKADGRSVYEYADEFARVQDDVSIREIVYGVLWDLACVDGVVSPAEQTILENLVRHLRIDPRQYAWQRSRHGLSGGAAGSDAGGPDPYDLLGCRRGDSDETVRRAYREKAKRLHPDLLRQRGLSDELMRDANEQMARVNAAWDEIRRERGL